MTDILSYVLYLRCNGVKDAIVYKTKRLNSTIHISLKIKSIFRLCFYFLLREHCQYWFEISTGHKWNKHLESEKKLLALLAPQKVLNKACGKVYSEDLVLKYERY